MWNDYLAVVYKAKASKAVGDVNSQAAVCRGRNVSEKRPKQKAVARADELLNCD